MGILQLVEGSGCGLQIAGNTPGTEFGFMADQRDVWFILPPLELPCGYLKGLRLIHA
jgi:hypothetical protein